MSNEKTNLIFAIIPARSGSKGVPGKNIKKLGGYPLIAYSIAACRLSKKINRIIVSTDSTEIAEIAESFGAEIPFIRPAKLAQDNSTDLEFIEHVITWFDVYEGVVPDYLIHIRPTTPLREPELIDDAILKIIENGNATSLRSVHEIRESPHKMLSMNGDFLEGLYPDDPRPEYYNLPRQNFPPVFQPNGYVDIIKSETVLKLKTLHGTKVLSFLTPDVGEIDVIDDFNFIEYMFHKKQYEIYEFLKNNY